MQCPVLIRCDTDFGLIVNQFGFAGSVLQDREVVFWMITGSMNQIHDVQIDFQPRELQFTVSCSCSPVYECMMIRIILDASNPLFGLMGIWETLDLA